jgi:hypothetical protein
MTLRIYLFSYLVKNCLLQRANILIYSNIQIFVSEYWIFEYEYQKFDFPNIFVFGQKINIRPTLMLRMFVRHGMVTYFILNCTLLPLVKYNLTTITTSENYRAMASDSLILKLLDIEILLLEWDKLPSYLQHLYVYLDC